MPRNYGVAFTNLRISLVIGCNQKTNSIVVAAGGIVPEFLRNEQLSVVSWHDPTEIGYVKFSKGMGGMRWREKHA